jgi:hypothetical protein
MLPVSQLEPEVRRIVLQLNTVVAVLKEKVEDLEARVAVLEGGP